MALLLASVLRALCAAVFLLGLARVLLKSTSSGVVSSEPSHPSTHHRPLHATCPRSTGWPQRNQA